MRNDTAEPVLTSSSMPPIIGAGSAKEKPAASEAAYDTADQVRAMIVDIDLEKCTSCGLCDPVCPADIIHMENSNGRAIPVIKFPEHCVTCFNCEIFCPVQCIDVHPIVRRRPLPW